ncbi:MAG: retropepsin-like aspartic protease [Candidatus Omnitrophica bacterium]|nr:retropepsin-like aspartic protease [Candidatus Omnitrophota bacterium]
MTADTRIHNGLLTARTICAVVTAGVLFEAAAGAVYADMAYLTNGRKMECLVKTQGRDTVELEVEIGTIRLRTAEISRIEKYSAAQNEEMFRQWGAHKAQADVARKAWQEAERVRQEQERTRREALPKEVNMDYANGHMIATARINKALAVRLLVDTGASIVVLSRAAGERLGLISASDTPGNKKINLVDLTLADGRKVTAKFVLLDSISVQDAEANRVETAIMLDDKAEVLYDGVLGMSFLKRFNVQFNNKENKLILEKLK